MTWIIVIVAAWAGGGESAAGLKKLQPLVGAWKTLATPIEANGRRSREFTRLSSEWVWRITNDQRALVWKVKEGRPYKGGLLSFDSATGLYRLELEPAEGDKAAYAGAATESKIDLVRLEGPGAGAERVRLNIAGEDRVVMILEKRVGKKWHSTLEIGNTREGVAFGGAVDGPECIVTGGKGTTPVTYGGKTYYVCCSGCKQAFHENPEKYIAEAKTKKK